MRRVRVRAGGLARMRTGRGREEGHPAPRPPSCHPKAYPSPTGCPPHDPRAPPVPPGGQGWRCACCRCSSWHTSVVAQLPARWQGLEKCHPAVSSSLPGHPSAGGCPQKQQSPLAVGRERNQAEGRLNKGRHKTKGGGWRPEERKTVNNRVKAPQPASKIQHGATFSSCPASIRLARCSGQKGRGRNGHTSVRGVGRAAGAASKNKSLPGRAGAGGKK